MPLKLKETNISNEHNRLNWRETAADQLAIYKHDRGVELGSTKKQLQLSGSAVAWGGAGGARAPPIIWQTPKNIY